jgi:hypothetical protein
MLAAPRAKQSPVVLHVSWSSVVTVASVSRRLAGGLNHILSGSLRRLDVLIDVVALSVLWPSNHIASDMPPVNSFRVDFFSGLVGEGACLVPLVPARAVPAPSP